MSLSFAMASKLMSFILVLFQISKFAFSQESGRAILQGTPATLGQFPYIVSVSNSPLTLGTTGSKGWKCTGAILTELWVVTGAHCYTGYESKNISISNVVTDISAGIIDYRSKTSVAQMRQCRHHVLMEVNKSKTINRVFNNDVAILRVSQPFVFDKYVGSITIAKRPLPEGKKITCTVVGFGLTKPNDKTNTKLYYTTGTLDGDKYSCRKRAKKNGYSDSEDWSEEHLCMDPVDYRSTPCNGDSGGPIVCDGLHTGTSVGRINTLGKEANCGVKGNYHVYMFLGVYEDWLRKHIPDLPQSRLVKASSIKTYQKKTSSGAGDRFRVTSIGLVLAIECILCRIFV